MLFSKNGTMTIDTNQVTREIRFFPLCLIARNLLVVYIWEPRCVLQFSVYCNHKSIVWKRKSYPTVPWKMHDTRPATVARFFQLSLVCLDHFHTVSKLSSVVKAVFVTWSWEKTSLWLHYILSPRWRELMMAWWRFLVLLISIRRRRWLWCSVSHVSFSEWCDEALIQPITMASRCTWSPRMILALSIKCSFSRHYSVSEKSWHRTSNITRHTCTCTCMYNRPPRKIHVSVSAALTEIDGINHRLKLFYDISWLIMSSQSQEKTKWPRSEGGTAALVAKRQKTIIVHSTQTLFLDVQAEILRNV